MYYGLPVCLSKIINMFVSILHTTVQPSQIIPFRPKIEHPSVQMSKIESV